MYIICFIITIAILSAVMDIVADETHWMSSVFYEFGIDSWFGCKQDTWSRKYNINFVRTGSLIQKVLIFLYTPFSDIWHFAKFLQLVAIVLLANAYRIDGVLVSVPVDMIIFFVVYGSVFEGFYEWLFKI